MSKRKVFGFLEIIAANLEKLFPGMRILETHPFRVTRNADMEIEEDEASDLLETIRAGVRQRRFNASMCRRTCPRSCWIGSRGI